MASLSAARRLLATALAAAFLSPLPLQAQAVRPSPATALAPSASPAASPAPAPRPWFYAHSDVPMDPAWHFGVLSNGVRYAVRHNEVPSGQVSIRVRVDVGSLMETPAQAGYAHFIEHLSFRGSREVPDGESKRIWQRLGASFGIDSNAQTTPTGTTYAVDLPDATTKGIDESLKILAGMVAEPNIIPAAVNAERSVVLAERREGLSPAAHVGDETRKFYFAGQPLGNHAPIGFEATLKAATAASLRAFHDRWYRPDRTVVVISGDADPAQLEAMVKKRFNNWHVSGPAAPLPDFGKPDPKAPTAKVVVEPNLPTSVNIAYLRPWQFHDDTIDFNERRLADDLALQLINRRLGLAATAGASFLDASVSQANSSRSVNATYVNIVPVGDDWEKALHQVRAIIADAEQTPPSQADIDREFHGLEVAYSQAVETSAVESSAAQADDLVSAIDIRETVVDPQAQLAIYRSARHYMTPDQLLAATRRMFTGTAERALLTLKAPEPEALARLKTAFREKVKPAHGVRLSDKPVTMDALPPLPPPGTVGAIQRIGQRGIEAIRFNNGVMLMLWPNKAEPGKVRINVRFGHGQQSFPPDEDAALWAAPFALMASGIGDLDQNALAELINGRQLSLNFSVDQNAFTMSAVSSPEDYKDQLRLYAEKLAFPRWDAAPLKRSIAALESGYDPVPSSAGEAINRDVAWLLRDKDERVAPATPTDAAELTLDKFKAIWAPLLATGPIEVQVFGDVDHDQAIAAVAATFGALPPRPDTVMPAENRIRRFPAPAATPVVIRHNGAKEQAAAVIAWPTGGGEADIRTSRHLEMLARIINDRLFEKLRSIDGAAYTPSADSVWPTGFTSGGYLEVESQLKPERIPYFFKLMNEIAADLAAHPVSADELERQVAPVRQLLSRAQAGNAFWMSQLEGLSRDPRRLAMASTLASDLLEVTPADLQALARRYLKPSTRWSAIVLAKGVSVPAVPQQAALPEPAAAPAGDNIPAPAEPAKAPAD